MATKRCAICDEPIKDKGRKYCAECRDWEKQVNASAGPLQLEECDHLVGIARGEYGQLELIPLSALKKTIYVRQFGYCPNCGERIRDEHGGLIVGEEWENGLDE